MHRTVSRQRLSLLAVLLAVSASAAHAQTRTSDGVVNLDQNLAIAGSATPGDAAGFPITITKAGTYRLTSSLVVPAGLDGIVVAPGLSVIIDLNGFHITGAASCALQAPCGPGDATGTVGIRSEGETSALKVSNGRIRGFTLAGVLGRSRGTGVPSTGLTTLEDVQVFNNQYGVLAGVLLAQRVMARDNAATGMQAISGLIQDSMAVRNAEGMWLQDGRISNSMALDNTVTGFGGFGNGKVLMHFNVARGNGAYASYNGLTTTNAF